jgi:hypothetical protein
VVELTAAECNDLVIFGILYETSLTAQSSNLDWAIIIPEEPSELRGAFDSESISKGIEYGSIEPRSMLLKLPKSSTYEEVWRLKLKEALSKSTPCN